jgi:quercetin 2,3-dioxygenase
MTKSVLSTAPLGNPPWVTRDPFLFCVHHLDAFPAGDANFGPAVSLEGRALGQDFAGKDGFNMYHGTTVPGFPGHPHRGFETVTVVRRGLVDHSDSLGAAARFGQGDAQWLTAGAGIVHAEMMPLLDREAPNPLELFQIWLNLPSEDKMAPPHFAMLWSESIPVVRTRDQAGRSSEIRVVAGAFGAHVPPAPPPRSYASRADSDVAIWTLRLDPGASVELPAAHHLEALRTLYFYRGSSITIDGEALRGKLAIDLVADRAAQLSAGDEPAELLLLQGVPIDEPVAAYGPFVMNTRAEIQQAMDDYRRTRFGGWPWSVDDPVHPADAGRFARHADGRIERR